MKRPVLDLDERDRRIGNILELVDAHDLDAILVFGLGTKFQFHQYLTQLRPGLAVLLTAEEELVAFSRNMSDFSTDDYVRNVIDIDVVEPWHDRLVEGGRWSVNLVAELERAGLDGGRVGVVGLGDTQVVIEPEGWVPYTSWTTVLEALPDTTFVDVTHEYAEQILPKGEAEIAALEVAARAGEAACDAMVSAAKAGMTEAELFAEGVAEMYRHGVEVAYDIFHTLPDGEGLAWGHPSWQFRTQPPRTMRRGDVVLTELFPNYGGLEAQQQLTIGLSPVHDDCRRGAELARESLERGVAAAKPGVRFGDVCDAMEAPILEAGGGWLTPLIHTLNPLYGIGRSGVNVEIDERHAAAFMHDDDSEGGHVAGDLVLEEGMLLELEPNCVFGRRRINIGGTFVVTDGGVRALEETPLRAHFV